MDSDVLPQNTPLATYFRELQTQVGQVKTRPLGSLDRVAIQRYALTIGATDPVHFDLDAAKAAGYRDVVAPPNMLAGTFEWGLGTPESELNRDGTPDRGSPASRELRGMGAGEEMTIASPVVAGDEIVLDEIVDSVVAKQTRGGPCVFVTTAHIFKAPSGEIYNHNRRTIVLRNPHEESE
ncbi:MaoC dehydratase-like protein [Antricoccus suffuscus]|uniref:MaoC dehydratase-like protein n=1 Tax=Antricoccus suffuscus TaxID=1629062 RepID=A0A2T1A686_9ACTN|nr:MaoC family dehydratase N-terminal domain-containing protein [Antricoccus suffuscus]PRZ44125.1 MaoC dehydratase-like protein [Antricoccus suffuscus]